MLLKQLQNKNLKGCLTGVIVGLMSTISATPVHALIPYIYEPSSEELQKDSLRMGRTAAQLLQLNQAKEAAHIAALAVRLEPNDERLWSIYADAQLRSNQLDGAKISLIRAKQLNPKKASLWFAEATIEMRKQRPAIAENLISQGLKLNPNNAGAYFDLGNSRIMQDNLKQALQAFEVASRLQPKFWEAINNQGLVLFELGNIKAAIKHWRNAIDIKGNAEPMLALAAALNQLNPGNTEAIELAKKALAKNPNYVWPNHQKEQLWGKQLRKSTSDLLKNPKLLSSLERAEANADTSQ